MPSSMIFAGLVVLWLLILVPAVARRRQEVARPSVAALSGRVLERPRQRQVPGQGPATGRREREVDGMDETGPDSRVEDDRDYDHDDVDGHGDDRDEVPARMAEEHDDRRWERPPPRYRPGRGGFDPEAAAIAARARYAFRQRVVLAMLIAALVTGVVAGRRRPRAVVGARRRRPRPRRLPRLPAPPGAPRGGDPCTPRSAHGRHPPTVSRRRPGARRLGAPRPRPHPPRRSASGDPVADDELADDHDEYDREGRPDDDIHDEEPERVAGSRPATRTTSPSRSTPSPRCRACTRPRRPRSRPAPRSSRSTRRTPNSTNSTAPAVSDYRRAAGE